MMSLSVSGMFEESLKEGTVLVHVAILGRVNKTRSIYLRVFIPSSEFLWTKATLYLQVNMYFQIRGYTRSVGGYLQVCTYFVHYK